MWVWEQWQYSLTPKSKTCDELGTQMPISWNTCTKHIKPSR